MKEYIQYLVNAVSQSNFTSCLFFPVLKKHVWSTHLKTSLAKKEGGRDGDVLINRGG